MVSQRQLDGSHTVSKQITETGCQENSDICIDFAFLAEFIYTVGNQRSGNRHRECICTDGSKSAMSQQNSLEQKDNQSQYTYSGRSEQNSSQSGTRHVRTASRHRGNLKRRYYKNKSSGHSQQNQCFPIFIQYLFNRHKSCCKKWQTDSTPGHTESYRKVTFHDVHGTCSRH